MLISPVNKMLKSFSFAERIYLGDPINTMRIFSQKSIDELIIFFIGQAKITSRVDYISKLLPEATFPITIGGGIHTVDDCVVLNRLGVEKFVLTSLYKNKNLIRSIASEFGSQATSVCFNYSFLKDLPNSKSNFFNRRETLLKAALWAQNEGAGELILQNIDRDGTQQGYDLETLDCVSQHMNIQLVAAGGASTLNDMRSAIDHGATAVAGSSMFFLGKSRHDILIRYPTEVMLADA